MKKEKEKNKICIIGHTKGIGKAIADISKFEVVGLSRSNGYDISKNLQKHISKNLLKHAGFFSPGLKSSTVINHHIYIPAYIYFLKFFKNHEFIIKETLCWAYRHIYIFEEISKI